MSRPYEPHRAHSDPPFKRRGRQATACTECNRRKQKVGGWWGLASRSTHTHAQCNGLRPCHHCSRRNLGDECRFPDSRALKTPGTWGPGGKHPRSDDDDDLDDEDSEAEAGSGGGGGAHSSRGSGHSHSGSTSSISEGIHAISPGSHHASHAGSSSQGAAAGVPPGIATPRNRAHLHHPSPLEPFPFRRPQPSPGHAFALPLSFDRTDPDERGVKWSKDPPGPSGHHQERDTLAKQPQSGTAKHDHTLMQEGGAPGIGSLAIEGSGVERQFQFYGTSHFGPRLAAQVMNVVGKVTLNNSADISDSQYGRGHKRQARRFGDLTAAVTDGSMVYHIRQLDGQVPNRSLCERFTRAYFDKYNDQIDFLYKPDFCAKYDTFWRIRGEFEDLSKIDIRWFALFHIVLAFGVLLDREADESGDLLEEREELSLRLFLSARRALSETSSFCGESVDTVRAYGLLSLYLIVTRRVPEAWQTIGAAARAAQAQGMHIDGEVWRSVDGKEAELRRRLWAQLYILDRSISLFLGRPLAIQDGGFTIRLPANIDDDELPLVPRHNWPLTKITKSTFLILHYRLAQIIGRIQTNCFGLGRREHTEVMACERLMLDWSANLPPVFRLDAPDKSMDEAHPWLGFQRQSLSSKYYQARISLHRPYLLTQLNDPDMSSELRTSLDACVFSALAELSLRLSMREVDADPFDRFKWMTVASGFSPATVVGILLAYPKRLKQFNYAHIRALYTEYLEVERKTTRRDESLENEIRVLDMILQHADAVEGEMASNGGDLPRSRIHSRATTPGGLHSTLLPFPASTDDCAFPTADNVPAWANLLDHLGEPPPEPSLPWTGQVFDEYQ
ncbi:putative transcriptional regulatory protein [Vanrija pseudolonga]|uniref:Purtative transcriptional regulatory protein n=1 Tax=Vanrija pseudolonga TaxID=143232 RepID=A0AAF1BMX2_9TREE|nr:purtative transcriptional regulatory protein [Vanrija pseudolonga]